MRLRNDDTRYGAITKLLHWGCCRTCDPVGKIAGKGGVSGTTIVDS
jgi:hypothetical protein